MRLSLALLVLAACGNSTPASSPADPDPVVAVVPPSPSAPDAAPIAIAPPPPPPDATPLPPPDAAPAIATWPFTAWDRAEAFLYNQTDFGPGMQYTVYADGSWSKLITERVAIDRALADRAVALTIATRGEVEVSKCPFPRHAIVLYAGDTPVGSMNVCFTCGDLLVWPEFEPGIDWDRYDDYTKKELAKFEKREQAKQKAYEKAYPKWEALFRDDLGWSIAPWEQSR